MILSEKKFCCFAVALVIAVSDAIPVGRSDAEPNIRNRTYTPLKVGSVTPKGWLLKQLQLQADGLSGHLSQFWPDIQQSIWIGGTADGGLHERAPYWLNGIVPLAYLLKNAGGHEKAFYQGIHKSKTPLPVSDAICKNGTDMRNSDITFFKTTNAEACRDACNTTDGCVGFVVDCPDENNQVTCWLKNANGATSSAACRCYGVLPAHPDTPVNIMDQSNKYVDYILKAQEPSGWLGPADNVKDGNVYWGRSNVILSLEQFAEAEPTRFAQVSQAVLKYLLELKRRITSPNYAQLAGWAAQRWMDIALGAEWLLVNAPQGHEDDLVSLIHLLHDQGSDWESWFQNFTGAAGGHNVNNAQAIKSSGVYYLMNGNETLHTLSLQRMHNLDEKYGLPTGMFNGDEILPQPATRYPSRGIELCGVVEAMFSYNTLFSVHGDVSFADRSELIAFNALPATWASPTGGDMWAHQYLQAVNQIHAQVDNPHVWTHDGADAELYGLEPNYGCCTANFNQGWPKWASMVVYTTNDGGAAVGLYAPSVSTLPDGSTVEIDTSYPYEDEVRLTVDAKRPMPLYVRIPAWATHATLDGQSVANGTMVKKPCVTGANTFKLDFAPQLVVKRWGDLPADASTGPVSIHRGPLMFSLPIGGNYTVVSHHFGGPNDSNDYQVEPTSPWQYAIDVDMENPGKTLTVKKGTYTPGAAPFNHTGWPITIAATVRPLPRWGINLNSAAVPPASPACTSGGTCGTPVQVELVPHGGTDLRMGELPQSGL
eukprot:m.258596 g.258596  ORF g.258596 m.258596 type:complete len:767 (-) comp19647_c0_seq1:385-2685(-)